MYSKITWKIKELVPFAYQIYEAIKKQKQTASEYSDWWAVGFSFAYVVQSLDDFIKGQYRFSPLQQFRFTDECVRIWNYSDKIILRCLLKILKPVFKYIIPDNCFHLAGPNGVRNALRYIQNALNTDKFQYAIRADIKSYYASIDHNILVSQVNEHFHDPKVKHYLEHIITTAVDDGGDVFIPEKGIPRRSSLSPFFGALYLSPLDRAFIKRKGIVYARYMDDIIILCQTKKQYQRARKILFKHLRALKIVLSPRKTWMGALKKGFHFLGANFDVSKREVKNQCPVTIHKRSCDRAFDKVKSLTNNGVYPPALQRYLVRWALWWTSAVKPFHFSSLILAWIFQANVRDPTLAWLGSGLLLHPCFHANLTP